MNVLMIFAGLDGLGFRVIHILVSLLWQSSLFFAAVMITSFFLRKVGARYRHVLWVFALLVMPLIPVFM